MAKNFLNEQNISDLVYARELADSSRLTIEKTSKGMKMALLGMACLYGGSLVSSVLFAIAASANMDFLSAIFSGLQLIVVLAYIVLSIYAVVVGGGFLKVLKTGGKVAKWAWYLIPVFPIDLISAIAAGYLVILGFIFFPAIYFWIMKRQAVKDLKAAETFIQAYENEASRFNQAEV